MLVAKAKQESDAMHAALLPVLKRDRLDLTAGKLGKEELDGPETGCCPSFNSMRRRRYRLRLHLDGRCSERSTNENHA
jgi:hypothetical protein